MSRKERRRAKRAETKDQKKAAPIKLNPMDVIRARAEASRGIVRAMTADGYQNCISKLGLDENNALSAGTYEFNLVTRNRIELEAAYRGSWFTGAIIDCVAQDMTRAGLDVTTSEGETKLQDLQAAFSRLQIWNSLCEGIQWGRLYGGALSIMDIAGQDLATPLALDSIGKGQFQGLITFDRWMLNPVMTPVIDSGPDMGLPKFYQIVTNPESYDPTSKTATGQLTVHYTRVFRHIGILLPFFQAITEMMWGESVLERLWDRLISFDNTTMSAASLVDRANLRTVGIEGLREIAGAGGDALEALKGQFELMRLAQVNEGLTLIDKNDEFSSTAYSFAGLSDMMLQQAQQLSGASEIPLVRLLGQSPAGLNSTGESDIRLYYDSINAKQEARLRRPCHTLLQVMWRSEFGEPAPKDLQFVFKPLWQMDAKDKAEVGKTNTETILGAVEGGLVSVPTAMKELRAHSVTTGVFGNITDEEITEAELEPAPLPDADPAATPGGLPATGANPQPVDKGVDKPEKQASQALDHKRLSDRLRKWLHFK